MELKYLQTFRVITEEGSFSKAAEKLNYTQSTITFQVGQLEQELGVQLFERIGRKMMLTKAGEQVIPYVDQVLESVEKLRFFETDLSTCQGELHIGVGETLLCFKLPKIVKEFHRRAPKARLFLRSMNCYDIRDELLKGTLDLGVFYRDVGGLGEQLVTVPMGSYPLALVASKEVKQEYPDFVAPNQSIPVPFLINEQRCIFRQLFEHYLAEKSITLDRTIELWSIPTIKNLVKSGMGVTFLPRFAVEEELMLGELEEIPTAIAGTEISAVCSYHSKKWISPLMQLFLNLCAETVHDRNLISD